MPPRISVVLPVYNAGPFLRPAIDGILNQTFRDFELIIINDGSTDTSADIIASYQDPRIRVITQSNQGVKASLNLGLELSQGEYIARMDHDDISYPERFAHQIKFLDEHPDYVVVGTTYVYIDTADQKTGIFPALLEDEDIRRELMTKSPLGHGSTMIRGSVIRANHIRYQSTYIDDYNLWMQLAKLGKLANIPQVLYAWRHRPGSITDLHDDKQRAESRLLQDATYSSQKIAELSSWPGWRRLQRYHNETAVVDGASMKVLRRNAHSSMYLNLTFLFVRHQAWMAALRCLGWAFLIQPIYPFQAVLIRLQPR